MLLQARIEELEREAGAKRSGGLVSNIFGNRSQPSRSTGSVPRIGRLEPAPFQETPEQEVVEDFSQVGLAAKSRCGNERGVHYQFTANDVPLINLFCERLAMSKRGMVILVGGIIVALSAVSSTSHSAEKVGKAVKINVTVTGAAGSIDTGDPVHRNERVRANASGLGQFEFRDGTKLAIGPNANVVIDKFVLGDGGTVKKLTIRATKGTFRFIAGRSSSKAYTIVTPAGTLGVRG